MNLKIIKLHDEVQIMQALQHDSITLTRHTDIVKPMKKLIEIHEQIELNLLVQEMFKDYKDAPIWDTAVLKDMNQNRCELMVYYHSDFHPFSMLDKFNRDLLRFFNLMQLRTQKSII